MNKKIITATLVLSLLASTPSFAAAPFTDVNDPSVDYAYENGLMSGMSATSFQPNTTLTRGQFATVFANLTREIPSGSLPFVDVKPTAYYYNPVLWAYNNNIVSGTTSKTFSPNATLNREQVASMVSDYWKKYLSDKKLEPTNFSDLNQASPWARDGIKFSGQVFKDAGISTAINFEPKKPFTRLEVAKLVGHLDRVKKTIPTPTPIPTPDTNNYNRMNNQLVNDWWAMIDAIKDEPLTPKVTQKPSLEVINQQRESLALPPLKLMYQLKPITELRTRKAFDLYKQNRPLVPLQNDIEGNKEVFRQTRFYAFIDKPESFKIFKNTFEKSFAEYVIYGSWNDTPRDIAGMLMRSPESYKLVMAPEYTHLYLTHYTDMKDAVWVLTLFNENAGRTLLRTLPVS